MGQRIKKRMGNCISKKDRMADYILSQQRVCGWRPLPLKPVLKCCIKQKSSQGFCEACKENFCYRNGPYYDGFRYRSDDELLERMKTGEKPFASIPRKTVDKKLEEKIQSFGLHIVRKFRNQWGMLVYNVMKNVDLKLSDVADLESVSELLEFDIFDMKICNIPEEPCKIFQGLMFGYPFYTLTIDDYLS